MAPPLLSAGVGAALLLLCLSASHAASPLSISWQGVTELATGAGDKGPWRQNASRYHYVDDPTVALRKDGVVAAAWVNQVDKDVFFQRIGADGAKKGTPVNVSRSPGTFSWLPRIAFHPDDAGRVYVLWQEIIFSGGSHGGDILFARSTDGGNSFTAPINLSESIGGDGKGRINRDVWSNGSLDLVAGADGNLYAAWTEYDGMLWLARSTDSGRSFSAPRKVTGDKQRPARGPTLALGNKQGKNQALYLAWTVGEDANANIHLARSRDHGESFSAPQQVGAGKGYADAPKLAIDDSGTLHLVYAQSASGPFGRYHVRYTRLTPGDNRFAAPRTISEMPAEVQASAAYPGLAVDAQGRLCVIWEVFPDAGARPRGLAIALSNDGGDTFTAPAMVPASRDSDGGTNGSHQGLLMQKLAMNDAGAIAIVNTSLLPNQHSRVWLMRGEWQKN